MTTRRPSRPGNPPANPQYYEFGDTAIEGIPKLTLTVPWDPATHVILDATATLEPGCRFTIFVFGLGPDHTPDSSPMKLGPVPVGTSTITTAAFEAIGLGTLELLTAQQSTALRP